MRNEKEREREEEGPLGAEARASRSRERILAAHRRGRVAAIYRRSTRGRVFPIPRAHRKEDRTADNFNDELREL